MNRNKVNRLLGIIIFILFISLSTYKVNLKKAESIKIGEKNRYETPIDISRSGYENTPDNTIRVTGDDFEDVLYSAIFAKKLKDSMLFFEKNSLSNPVKNKLSRIKGKKVYIVGDTGVIPDKIEKSLIRLGIKTERISNIDRYETSSEIREKIRQIKKAYIIDNYSLKDFADNQKIFNSDRYKINGNNTSRFHEKLRFKNIYMVTGENFSGELYGYVLTRKYFLPTALTANNKDNVKKEILNSNKFLVENTIIIDGEDVVSNEKASANSNIKIKNSKKYLNIPTYDKSNEAVHPKVLYFPNGFGGWKYWMAYTPYPKGDDLFENPSIACSNDGISWTTPRGLSNPLIKPPTVRGEHYSDTHIVYNKNTKELELWYRFTHFDVQDKIYRMTTKDGIHWSHPKLMLMYEGNKTCYSPALLYEDNKYKLWYVNEKYQVIFRNSNDGQNWTEGIPVNIKLQDLYLPWHLDIIHTDKGYEMLLTVFKDGQRASNNMILVWGTSANGLNYNKISTIITPTASSNAWDNKQIYRSTFVKVDDIYKVYYSAMNNNHEWHIGLSQGYSLDELYGYSLE